MTSQGSHEVLILNCLPWGRNFNTSMFDVSIASDTKITVLKKAICDEANEGWLPHTSRFGNIDENIGNTLKELKLEDSGEVKVMKPSKLLSAYYQSPPPPEHLHIIVELEP
ncbi:hypothetical protein FRC03_006848, partial [Tulasnella sp. 419]